MRVAILHQSAPVPAVGGVSKPMKPGGKLDELCVRRLIAGYSDSSADLAYNLRAAGVDVVTPVASPNPTRDLDWSFGDEQSTILAAVRNHGATALWANTVLHSRHALVELSKEIPEVKLVGQNPFNTEKFDDKQWTNAYLAKQDGLTEAFPKAKLFGKGDDIAELVDMGLPLVAKPIRGRGSHGVTLVKTPEELGKAVKALLEESESILVEEFLGGEEITITVMPPGDYDVGPWQCGSASRDFGIAI